ncbi:uncharacterized protein prr14 [Archocentrus centrarchus]|uniref:uncharacterized protein prr14 n=1 Tax=Archocentrus centrarchus TaxID=63155 RepID=UPI0011EA0D0C|nr:uncharacterized protein LOC115785018 [Archocentrus centrarchus]XP_030592309.1 uncharacterized protein LOC115785018 [Archocentrus centrarchus]
MLTYPSDSLTQIVCPMDEDPKPPNPFCSAPPHSEPPPPFLSLSSITPSCAKDGISGHRRSGRIQGIQAQTPKKHSSTDGQAAQRPCRQNPSPTKRQRESGIMVQVAQSKLSRAEGTDVHESQNKDGFDFDFTAKCQNRQKDQKAPQMKLNLSPGENVAELLDENTTQSLDAPKSDMDTCGYLAAEQTAENAYSSKGWAIGPLFQSLKSKMASFTEIVMSPVKLFRATSPPLPANDPDGLIELKTDGANDVECSEPSSTLHPEGQRENENQDDNASQHEFTGVEDAQNIKMVAPKYCKKLKFVGDSTSSFQKVDEFAVHQKEKNSPALVPLPHCPSPCTVSEPVGSSIILRSSTNASASCESRSKMSSALMFQKVKTSVHLKPRHRKRAGNRSDLKTVNSTEVSDPEVRDKQLSYQSLVQSNNLDSSDSEKMLSSSFSVCYTQPEVDCFQPDGDEKNGNTESCRLVRQTLQKSLNDGVNKRTLRSTLDLQQQECLLNPVKCSVSEKRGLKLNCHSQDSIKRKRLTADTHTEDAQKQELSNIASGSGIMRGLRLEEIELINEEAPKLVRQRPVVFVSTRVTRKGKSGQEMLATINEAVLHSQTESSPDAMFVCSQDKTTGVLEDNHTGCSIKAKTAASCKRQKRTVLSKSDVNIDSIMDLETTVAITSTKQDEPSPEALVHPHIKQLQSTSKCGNINKKPQKRKSPNQMSSRTESGSSLVSTSSVLSVEQLELMPKDVNTSQHAEKGKDSMRGLSHLSKRPKKGLGGAPQSFGSSGTQETQPCVNLNFITKESQSKGKSKNTTDPVYFEMTPFESSFQPIPLPPQLNLDCPLKINIENRHVAHRKLKSSASVAEEIFHIDSEVGNDGSFNLSRLRSSTRRANIKPRQADNQRKKCRVLHSRTHKSEEVTNSVTMDDASLATSGALSSKNSFSNRLLRSYSCPEILCLRPHDTTWTSPHLSRAHTSHQSSHSPSVSHAPKSLRRARRHTVCSVEVEREIAPLCLRKEVYPSRRSAPYDPITHHLPPSLALSPSTSISALASCFLSSPLAFLSKKFDSKGAAGSPSTSSHVFSPSSSFSLTSPLSSSTWHHSRTDSSGAAMDSSTSGNPSECETERRQQSEEDDDGEDTSSSSQEFEDVGLREEKALSDSEIKEVQKHEERRKVSSIRIRKTLPKPQNNLTPMGLPKPIRLKKKEFSLEEIYTNKNFSKPPESRLETIFEVPLNRRNGSESWFGQRRVKRFLEFLEVGEARKPKKPLVGVGKAGISTSRTRRGGFLKDEPSLSVQDVDSLLCAKLDQLNLWLIRDQKDS